MGDHEDQSQEMSRHGVLELPAGFRFYPSDEEIILFYLMPKVHERNFTCTTIGDINFNRTEPWELLEKAKMGEKEYYFFYQKDPKYPRGTRTNRATDGGYWKSTGKDKQIYRATTPPELPKLIGMKKTLVFYRGKAPTSKKTDWVLHEFRLEGSSKLPHPTSSSTFSATMTSSVPKDDWVVCRVFDKTTGIKRTPILPPYNMAMAGGEITHTNTTMPMSFQFPMLPDFTMDPMASYCSNAGPSSSSMPPMAGMGSINLQNTMFGNPMAMVPLMSHQKMIMGALGSSTFIPTLKSGPLFMFSQKDTEMSSNQTNATKISSMVSATPESVATTDVEGTLESVATTCVDGIWKY